VSQSSPAAAPDLHGAPPPSTAGSAVTAILISPHAAALATGLASHARAGDPGKATLPQAWWVPHWPADRGGHGPAARRRDNSQRPWRSRSGAQALCRHVGAARGGGGGCGSVSRTPTAGARGVVDAVVRGVGAPGVGVPGVVRQELGPRWMTLMRVQGSAMLRAAVTAHAPWGGAKAAAWDVARPAAGQGPPQATARTTDVDHTVAASPSGVRAGTSAEIDALSLGPLLGPRPQGGGVRGCGLWGRRLDRGRRARLRATIPCNPGLEVLTGLAAPPLRRWPAGARPLGRWWGAAARPWAPCTVSRNDPMQPGIGSADGACGAVGAPVAGRRPALKAMVGSGGSTMAPCTVSRNESMQPGSRVVGETSGEVHAPVMGHESLSRPWTASRHTGGWVPPGVGRALARWMGGGMAPRVAKARNDPMQPEDAGIVRRGDGACCRTYGADRWPARTDGGVRCGAGARAGGRVWCDGEDCNDTPCNVARWRWVAPVERGGWPAGGFGAGAPLPDAPPSKGKEKRYDTPCNVVRWRWAGVAPVARGGLAGWRVWCGGPLSPTLPLKGGGRSAMTPHATWCGGGGRGWRRWSGVAWPAGGFGAAAPSPRPSPSRGGGEAR